QIQWMSTGILPDPFCRGARASVLCAGHHDALPCLARHGSCPAREAPPGRSALVSRAERLEDRLELDEIGPHKRIRSHDCIFHGCLPPNPWEGCHSVHVKPATQSMGTLPPSPRERCHVDHGKVATHSRRSLPPSEQRDAGTLLLV